MPKIPRPISRERFCTWIPSRAARPTAPELLCQEYTLQADQTVYRIRQRDQKRPVLLPVSDRAQFRLRKDKMLLRVEDLDFKEREYEVISTAPRTDSTAADATPAHLNHLQ